MSKNGLFDDFPEVSAKQWKQKIQVDLNGADYNDMLVWESPEGIKVKPFYHTEDLKEDSLLPTSPEKWNIAQAIYAGNAKLANKKALNAIERGAESIIFTIPSEDISIYELLNQINASVTSIYFDFKFLSLRFVKNVLEATKNNGNVFLNMDIIGNLAKSGNWYYNLKKDHDLLGEIIRLNHKNTVCVDVSLYQNAGATIVQQLAYALAHGNEYLNHFSSSERRDGRSITITFIISMGSNYFFEIAKLKALRLLWATLSLEYGMKSECHILAIPSKRNKTLYDYNVNMLRTTTECMSAILGGTDTVCNLAYDSIYHKDNEFGERIARNQLLLLKNESYFNDVSQVAKGSYYIETLTQQLAEKALELFKNIEAGGGFMHQLKNHTIQQKIKESAQKEQEKFNAQEEVLVGTNKYQNKDEHMRDDLELYPFVKIVPRKTLLEPIIEKRLAEEMEQKRLKNE
ncbi:methylmalonyl-CoA mutase [Saonia flava]|uniref:Methylmalonyl-CoA mutase n=1 Tax=Saonia flava TaxID=523696 RepID=A0A846QZA7_9FLAO|nr:methylmalonyl-CoA mutase subunit beta [Saonia flava]NJB72260.1 methylmalonyl-CoA mutase [Saonia flava]